MRELRSATKAPEQPRIYTAGEKEYYNTQRVQAEGVEITPGVQKALQTLATRIKSVQNMIWASDADIYSRSYLSLQHILGDSVHLRFAICLTFVSHTAGYRLCCFFERFCNFGNPLRCHPAGWAGDYQLLRSLFPCD